MSQTLSNQPLIEECQGLVRSLALSIHRKLPAHVQLDDLISYGQIGLIEAARDFDEARGNRFSTYAYYRIRGAIYDGMAKMNWGSKAQYQQARYNQMSGEVLGDQAAGQEGSAVSAAADSDASWFRDLSRKLAVVYLMSRLGSTDDGQQFAAQMADPDQETPDAQAMDHEECARLNKLIDSLPSDERQLIRATYFEGTSLQEAGERLGVSKSWASRLHAKALQRLARSLKLLGLTN